MPKIGPAQSYKDLEKSAVDTYEGKKKGKDLPGLKTDAKTVRADKYKENAKLAEAIADAMASTKDKANSNDEGPLFVLAWRMYPNKDNSHWKGKTHSCGCGCACFGKRKPRPRRPGP